MADFQDLEIRLQAVDNASHVLQKIVDQLEQIKKLTSGSNNITPTGGNSSEIKKAAIIKVLPFITAARRA